MSWWDEHGLAVMFLAVGLVALGGVFAGAIAMDRYSCRIQADALGLENTWGLLQGCIVVRRDGIRVPIENYGRADRD